MVGLVDSAQPVIAIARAGTCTHPLCHCLFHCMQADVLGLPLTPEQQRLQVLLACLEDCQYWPFLQEYATAGQRLQGLFTSALHLLFGPATSLNLQHLAYPQLVQHLEGDLDQADVLKQLLIVYDGPPNSLYLPVHTVAEVRATAACSNFVRARRPDLPTISTRTYQKCIAA